MEKYPSLVEGTGLENREVGNDAGVRIPLSPPYIIADPAAESAVGTSMNGAVFASVSGASVSAGADEVSAGTGGVPFLLRKIKKRDTPTIRMITAAKTIYPGFTPSPRLLTYFSLRPLLLLCGGVRSRRPLCPFIVFTS